MSGTAEPANAVIVHAGDGRQDAVDLGDGVFMSSDVSNLYRIVMPGGDVMINAGMAIHAEENARRFAAVSDNPVAALVFTQSHVDHIGGWRTFVGPGTEVVAQANFAHVRGYWRDLDPTISRRVGRLWGRDLPVFAGSQLAPEPEITTKFHDRHSLIVGGRELELYATPGGETLDSLVVWMPRERIAFSGNLTGPLFGHVPNLYTLRGDKIRYVQWFIDGVRRVIDLEPEMLVTGHGDPIRGVEEITRRLGRIRDAAIHLRTKTIEGMNAGVDLWTLMRTVELPPELAIGQGHGKVPWLVRAIWEEHLGWFRFESTTELYDTPVNAVLPELIDAAGGAAGVAARARAHVEAGRPLPAIHLAEAALAAQPDCEAALEALLAAHELLLDQRGRENFSEVRWLESEIRTLRERRDAALA